MGETNLDKDAVATAPSAPSSTPALQLKPMQHVTKALARLKEAGLALDKTSTADSPLVTILSELAPLGESDVVAIARTMAHMENFNDMIRKKSADIRVGNRFEEIAESFNSIREDSANMVKRAEKGRITVMDRASEAYMKFRRGTIGERFNKISDAASKVFKDTEGQLCLERAMVESYKLMRLAIKESQLLAGGLRDKATAQLQEAQELLRKAQTEVDNAPDNNARAAAELNRDRALAITQACDRRFQTAEDIYNGLTVSYATGDAVVARLAQTTDAKERVLRQSVAFFSTNQSTLAALGVTLTGLEGLNETTRTLQAMKKGTEDALAALTNTGTQLQENALREGYGATINASAVKALMDSVIAYQERSHEIIKEMRHVAAENAQILNATVEEGKNKLVELVHRQAAENTVSGSEGSSTPALEYQPSEVDTTMGVIEGASRQKTEQRLAQAMRSDR